MAEEAAPGTAPPQYDRIRGWLILVGVGVILQPIRILLFTIRDLTPALSEEVWPQLTTPGTDVYHPLWGPLILFELAGNSAFILFHLVLAIFFFRKRRLFPKLMITLLLSNMVFVVGDYFLAQRIPAVAAEPDFQSIKEVFRVLFGCLIWVPYFLVSKRVKGTFTR